MGKTFGDFIRQLGGRPPEVVEPADECAVSFWEEQEEIARENLGDVSSEQLAYEEQENAAVLEALEILGDEADYALCENCHVSVPVDEGVTCEGCGVFYANHGRGRNNCWKSHNCGKLITSAGYLVKVGDILVYPSHADEFEVIEMAGTWVKGGHARGLRKRGNYEMPIIPRLMYHKAS